MARHEPYPLTQFREDFPDHDACLEYLWRTGYAAADGEHAECPKCQSVQRFKRYATAQKRQSWTCTTCGHHIQPTAGTIFHKSTTSLQLWFTAIYLISATGGDISVKQLERELGVTYKTAWRISTLIRGRLAGVPAPVPDVVAAARPAEVREEAVPLGHRDFEPGGGGLLQRRVRRQIARVTHDERIARHQATELYNHGIDAVSQAEQRIRNWRRARNRPGGSA